MATVDQLQARNAKGMAKWAVMTVAIGEVDAVHFRELKTGIEKVLV